MQLPDYIKDRYWKDFLPAGMTVEIDIPEDISLVDIFKNGAQEYGNQICMDYYGREFTFNEMNILTRRFARGLHNLGVKKGDVVAIWSPNCPHFSFAYFAALSLGATLTALSPLFVAREILYQIKDSGAKFLILIDRFYSQYERVHTELDLKKVIVMNVEGKIPDIPETDKVIHFNTIMEQNVSPLTDSELKVNINPKKDIAVIQYTGGTTGLPKGACLSHYNIIANMLQMKQISDYMKNEYIKSNFINLSVLPWYHIYGQTCELAQAPLIGAKGYILATFDIPTILEIIEKKKPNLMLGVPTMFISLLNYPQSKNVDFSSLKYANVGAGSLPTEVFKAWKDKTGFEMGEGYGLSETSPTVTNSPPWARKKYGSCGHPVANTLVGIIDENLNFLPIGEAGELVVSGPQVMVGYLNRPKENKKVFFEAGGFRWLRTGDFAKLDEEGYIFILDRVKDMIKYKGHSVYPREIEEILYEHPAIMECSVFGVPDPMKGEQIVAYIILKPEYKGKVSEDEILHFAKENLAAYKYPRLIKFVRNLPKSAVGKVLRRVIREKEEKKRK